MDLISYGRKNQGTNTFITLLNIMGRKEYSSRNATKLERIQFRYLKEQNLLRGGNRSKSAYLTEVGIEEAKKLAQKYIGQVDSN